MMRLLDRERQNIQANLDRTVTLKTKSLVSLRFYSNSYGVLILHNIIRIQKWFRACRQRWFFKNLLRQERDRQWAKLHIQLNDMTDTIEVLARKVEDKNTKHMEESVRDKAKEQFEEAQRKKTQESKAKAIMKFEAAMVPLVTRSLKAATVKTLSEVKTPIFNRNFTQLIIDADSSDSCGNSKQPKKTIKNSKSFNVPRGGRYANIL